MFSTLCSWTRPKGSHGSRSIARSLTLSLLKKIMEQMNIATRRKPDSMDPSSLEYDPLAEIRRVTSPDAINSSVRSERAKQLMTD